MLCVWKTHNAECMDKELCFLLKHRNIIATAYCILLLKPSFVISQGQPCWHTFHALMSAKNKRPIKCVEPKLTPLYFHSSHAWYAWLLYYNIQQFFLECVIMHECNNNFAFPSHSYIYTAILNIHCFFFPLVYKSCAGLYSDIPSHIEFILPYLCWVWIKLRKIIHDVWYHYHEILIS